MLSRGTAKNVNFGINQVIRALKRYTLVLIRNTHVCQNDTNSTWLTLAKKYCKSRRAHIQPSRPNTLATRKPETDMSMSLSLAHHFCNFITDDQTAALGLGTMTLRRDLFIDFDERICSVGIAPSRIDRHGIVIIYGGHDGLNEFEENEKVLIHPGLFASPCEVG